MISYKLKFVGKRFVVGGRIVRVVGETDSGIIKTAHPYHGESWSDISKLQDIDGKNEQFRVLPVAA